MNICIFGAGGRTGKFVVAKALERGHSVTAFIYNAQGVQIKDVKIIVGNVLNIDDVKKAVNGADVIISVIGHMKDSNPLLQTKGIKNIVKAMKEYGITRIISLTGTGVRQDNDTPSFIDRLLNIIISLIDYERVNDGIFHAEILKASNLDWSIVRVLKLTNSESTGSSIKLTESGPAELFTPRKKVASILVRLAESNEFIRKMPISS